MSRRHALCGARASFPFSRAFGEAAGPRGRLSFRGFFRALSPPLLFALLVSFRLAVRAPVPWGGRPSAAAQARAFGALAKRFPTSSSPVSPCPSPFFYSVRCCYTTQDDTITGQPFVFRPACGVSTTRSTESRAGDTFILRRDCGKGGRNILPRLDGATPPGQGTVSRRRWIAPPSLYVGCKSCHLCRVATRARADHTRPG